jgi:WD40 repeat protein
VIHLWDLGTRREIRTLQTVEPHEVEVAFSPTEHVVAWAGENSLGILDYETGQTNTIQLSRDEGYSNAAFSPDGREVVGAQSTNIIILDLATWHPRPFAPIQSAVLSLAFSLNGSLIAGAHLDGTLTLWERASGRAITNIPAHSALAFGVEFSRDGRTLASSGSDAAARLWDVIPGGLKLRHTLRGHVGWVDFAFSPDGRRLVSKGMDNALKFWDPTTGLEVGTLYGQGGGVAGFAFSSDGNALYSATPGGEIRTWRAPPLDRLEASEKEKKVKQ